MWAHQHHVAVMRVPAAFNTLTAKEKRCVASKFDLRPDMTLKDVEGLHLSKQLEVSLAIVGAAAEDALEYWGLELGKEFQPAQWQSIGWRVHVEKVMADIGS